ncbi:MAG: hypothetical protein ACR2GY_07485 [Phycisphaerales bacterium]
MPATLSIVILALATAGTQPPWPEREPSEYVRNILSCDEAQRRQMHLIYDESEEIYLAEELIDILISTIEPTAWEQCGGPAASVRYYKGMLIITAPPYIHREVEEILTSLRAS